MTDQEAFNKVCEHLAEQASPASRVTGGLISRKMNVPAYYSIDGKKSSLGILIPDEDYRPTLEGRSVPNIFIWDHSTGSILGYTVFPHEELPNVQPWNKRKCALSGLNVRMLDRLQNAHDSADSAIELKDWLVKIAWDFGLDAKKVELINEWESIWSLA